MSNIALNVAAILPYVQALQAITLGAQPLTVDGQSAGSWDPLGSMPSVESALQTAQQHCDALQDSTLLVLQFYPIYFASVVGSVGSSGIVNDLAQVATVMAQLSGGATPTAAQRQTVNSALADIVSQVSGMQTTIAGAQAGAATFQDQLAGDIEALNTNAQTSVAAAISGLQTAYENAAIQYSMYPGGSAIVAILGQITGQMNTALTNIENNINAAVSAENGVAPALTQLQDLFAGLFNDYTSFAQEAQKASDAQFGGVMQQIDCTVLQQYWQDTSAYASANGFGMPPG